MFADDATLYLASNEITTCIWIDTNHSKRMWDLKDRLISNKKARKSEQRKSTSKND